jgi:hypothetical protein
LEILNILVSFICYYRSQISWSKYYYDLIVHQPFLGYYYICYVISNPTGRDREQSKCFAFCWKELGSGHWCLGPLNYPSSVTWSSVLPALLTVYTFALPPLSLTITCSTFCPARSSAFSDSAYLGPSCLISTVDRIIQGQGSNPEIKNPNNKLIKRRKKKT